MSSAKYKATLHANIRIFIHIYTGLHIYLCTCLLCIDLPGKIVCYDSTKIVDSIFQLPIVFPSASLRVCSHFLGCNVQMDVNLTPYQVVQCNHILLNEDLVYRRNFLLPPI